MFDPVEINQICMGCMSKVEDKELPCPYCGWLDSARLEFVHQLPPQTILNGKYLVGRVLGEGGFGITYLGWDLNLDMKVAIKEYYPSGFVTRETTATTTVIPFTGEKGEAYFNGLDKFVGEAKSLAKFFALPGIVSVKDFFRENGTAYIVMEYIEGVTLKQYLKDQGGRLPPDLVFDLVKPLINSLSKMHEAGIIHRDISPDNIMLTKEGGIKLLDFGAARDFSSNGAKSLSVLLKPGYAPEEQYRTRGKQGPWTDVYALCATLYKMITGDTPPESMERMREDPLIPPSGLGVVIPENQEASLLKGMAVYQENRYQGMGELYDTLFSSPLNVMSPRPAVRLPSSNVCEENARTLPLDQNSEASNEITLPLYNPGGYAMKPLPEDLEMITAVKAIPTKPSPPAPIPFSRACMDYVMKPLPEDSQVVAERKPSMVRITAQPKQEDLPQHKVFSNYVMKPLDEPEPVRAEDQKKKKQKWFDY